MQATEFLIKVDQTSGNSCKSATALIGGACYIHGVRHRFEKGLKATLGDALLAQFVKPLLCLDDLFLGFGGDLDLGRFGRQYRGQGRSTRAARPDHRSSAHSRALHRPRLRRLRGGRDRPGRQVPLARRHPRKTASRSPVKRGRFSGCGRRHVQRCADVRDRRNARV